MWKRNCSSLGRARGRPPERALTVGDKAVHRDAHGIDQHGFKLDAPERRTMIVMTFTIELDIGLSCHLQSALPLAWLATDRATKTHRRGRSKRSRPLPAPHPPPPLPSALPRFCIPPNRERKPPRGGRPKRSRPWPPPPGDRGGGPPAAPPPKNRLFSAAGVPRKPRR